MKKILLAVFLVLFALSCAPLMEETWTVTTPEGPVTVRHYDPARELLLGFYIADLINPPKTRYSYPVIGSYLSGYSYCPPDIWRDWSPLQRSLWIQSGIDSELRDYEYKLKSINDMQMFQMKLDAQRIIDDLERETERAKDELESKKEEAEDAADELKDAADDTKLELENAAWWAKFMESAVADAEVARLVAENAKVETRVLSDKRKTLSTEEFFPSMKKETSEKSTDFDFSFLDDGRLPSEDQVEVTQWFGPSAGKKFVSVGIDYANRAQGLYFSVERGILGPDDPSNLLYSGEVVLYGTRWPPKPAIDEDTVFWTKYVQSNEKEKEEMRATARMDKGILVSPSGKRLFEEKEVSRIVKNGLANAIKEIIDELGER